MIGIRKNVLKEHKIGDYKADIYIKDTNTIIEIKSIITTNRLGIFPTVYSERTLNQLEKIQDLLSQGYKVCFIIISLNPYVRKIKIDQKTKFFNCFHDCIEKGMIIKGYTCDLIGGNLKINKEIELDI